MLLLLQKGHPASQCTWHPVSDPDPPDPFWEARGREDRWRPREAPSPTVLGSGFEEPRRSRDTLVFASKTMSMALAAHGPSPPAPGSKAGGKGDQLLGHQGEGGKGSTGAKVKG